VLGQLSGTLAYSWGKLHGAVRPGDVAAADCSPAWLPCAPPIRLLHLSDLHVERLTRREAHLLELVKEARPDLIVITGDYLTVLRERANRPGRGAAGAGKTARAVWGLRHPGQPAGRPARIPPPLCRQPGHIRLLRMKWRCCVSPMAGLIPAGMDCDHDLAVDAQSSTDYATGPGRLCQGLLYHSPE